MTTAYRGESFYRFIMLTNTDKAYLAGLIDGEGCISIVRGTYKSGNPYYRLLIVVSQNDKIVLQYWRDKTGFGSIHTLRKDTKRWTAQHTWQISTAQALT